MDYVIIFMSEVMFFVMSLSISFKCYMVSWCIWSVILWVFKSFIIELKISVIFEDFYESWYVLYVNIIRSYWYYIRERFLVLCEVNFMVMVFFNESVMYKVYEIKSYVMFIFKFIYYSIWVKVVIIWKMESFSEYMEVDFVVMLMVNYCVYCMVNVEKKFVVMIVVSKSCVVSEIISKVVVYDNRYIKFFSINCMFYFIFISFSCCVKVVFFNFISFSLWFVDSFSYEKEMVMLVYEWLWVYVFVIFSEVKFIMEIFVYCMFVVFSWKIKFRFNSIFKEFMFVFVKFIMFNLDFVRSILESFIVCYWNMKVF